MPTVNIDDDELYYETHGAFDGRTPLVLVPGFSNGSWIWFRQTEELARHVPVIIYDPPGIGRSFDSPAPGTIGGNADVLCGLLATLEIRRAHVLGISFGGFVAQEVALGCPQTVASLILCCTSFGGKNHVAPSAETLALMASTKNLNTEERTRENLLLAFSPEFRANEPQTIEEVVRLREQNPASEAAYANQIRAAVAFDAEARVAGIRARTLVITGDRDEIVPAENSRRLHAAIPGSQLAIHRGGSHMFFIERPHAFNSNVLRFIEDSERLAVSSES